MKLSGEVRVSASQFGIEVHNGKNFRAELLDKSLWAIETDRNPFQTSGFSLGYKIISKDELSPIQDFVVGHNSMSVKFRDKSVHEEAIRKSHIKEAPCIDDSYDHLDHAQRLSIWFDIQSVNYDKFVKEIATLFHLLMKIDGDRFISALRSVICYLDECSEVGSAEVVSFMGALAVIEDKAFDQIDQLNLTSNARWFLINQLVELIPEQCEHSGVIIANVIELCASVGELSVNYKAANEIMQGLLCTPCENENAEQRIYRLEMRLRCALRAENQKQVDFIFHELSGETGLQPYITGIEGDEETLVKMAGVIRQKNEMIKSLQQSQPATLPKQPKTPEPMRFQFNESGPRKEKQGGDSLDRSVLFLG